MNDSSNCDVGINYYCSLVVATWPPAAVVAAGATVALVANKHGSIKTCTKRCVSGLHTVAIDASELVRTGVGLNSVCECTVSVISRRIALRSKM